MHFTVRGGAGYSAGNGFHGALSGRSRYLGQWVGADAVAGDIARGSAYLRAGAIAVRVVGMP